MKILLFTPPWSHKKLRPEYMAKKGKIKGLGSKDGLVSGIKPPFALLYLSSALKGDGHEVIILDGYFHSESEILEKINKESPEIVGISSVSPLWEKTKEIAGEIKRKFPEVFLIFGGKHAMIEEEECLEECEHLDALVYQEGEEIIRKIASKLEQGESIKDVHGTVIRGENGEIKRNPRAPPPDINSLPFPAREDIDFERYVPSIAFFRKLPHASTFTSRGCPFNCGFCHTSTQKFRCRSPENILEEVDELVEKYKAKDITFYDETFTVPKDRAIKICDKIIERDYDIIWSANARVDTVDKELLHKMREAGCWKIAYGIESGVQKNLDKLGKGIDIEEVKEAIGLTNKIGIETWGMFMFGIPGETYEEGLRTIEFARDLDLDYASFLFYAPFRGTPLYKTALEEGERVNSPYSLNFWNISYVPDSMRIEELKELQNIANRKFYLRPGYILKKLRRTNSLTDLKRNLRGFMSFLSLRNSLSKTTR